MLLIIMFGVLTICITIYLYTIFRQLLNFEKRTISNLNEVHNELLYTLNDITIQLKNIQKILDDKNNE